MKSRARQELVDRHLSIIPLLTHQNIVQTVKLYHNAQLACIVMEKMDQNLLAYVVQNGRLSEDKARLLFLQLTLAVNYMHYTTRIAHGSITCTNILVDHKFNLKLAGFSQSQHILKGVLYSCSGHAGDVNYLAPEILTKVFYDIKKVDVFSMGVVLHVLITGGYPWRNSLEEPDLDEIWGLDVSDSCRKLLVSLLHSFPCQRCNTEQILLHDWMTQTPTDQSKQRLEPEASGSGACGGHMGGD